MVVLSFIVVSPSITLCQGRSMRRRRPVLERFIRRGGPRFRGSREKSIPRLPEVVTVCGYGAS